MMKLFAMALAVVGLAGCASSVMETYVGQDITDVVVRYGPPLHSFEMPDGRIAFQWQDVNDIFVPMTTTYSDYGYGGYATTTGGYAGSYSCVYTFYTQANSRGSYTVVGFEQPSWECE